MKKLSLWLDTSAPPDFPKLRGRVAADVVVVGGGITGLTTAYLLKRIGCRVAVVDQRTIGGGETAHTTATSASMNWLPRSERGKLRRCGAPATWQ